MIAALMLATACGEPDTESGATDAVQNPTTTEFDEAGPEASGGDQAVTLADEDRTAVYDLLGWSRRDGDALERQLMSDVARATAREDVLVTCMAAEGFDYFPLPQQNRFGLVEDPDAPRGSEAFAERYGFGVSTLAFPLDIVGPEALGFDQDWLQIDVPSFDENPNAGYYADLDDAGQAAYDRALGGEDGRGGCQAEALDTVPEPAVTRDLLAEELSELDDRVAADGRFVAFAADVDECMQIGQFTFVGYDEMEDEIERRLIESELASDGTRAPAELEPDEMKNRLLPIQAFEIELAAEFERCAEGFDGWHDQVDEIAETYRTEFLNNHADTLGLGGSGNW